MHLKSPFRPERAEEANLRARVTELEASCRRKDQFVSNLSHQLRSPLTAILLWTTLLRAGEVAENEREEALRILGESARELQKLAEDLVKLARATPARRPA